MILDCPHCEARVHAKLLKTHHYSDEDLDHEISFVACPSCEAPLLASKTTYPDGSEGDNHRIYPPTSSLSLTVPAPLRRSFHEATTCLSCGSYLAAVLMCRRTIEGLCHHHGRKSGLAAGLKHLHGAKIIDDRLFEWAETLRRDGNLAAHDPDAAISRLDAIDLIQFTHAILDYVFVLHYRFETFKKRRAEHAKVKQATKSAPAAKSP